jgi:hypothetical protein
LHQIRFFTAAYNLRQERTAPLSLIKRIIKPSAGAIRDIEGKVPGFFAPRGNHAGTREKKPTDTVLTQQKNRKPSSARRLVVCAMSAMGGDALEPCAIQSNTAANGRG